MKLIDLDKTIAKWSKCLETMSVDKYGNVPVDFRLCIKALSATHTVDAVEVVRCKNCERKPTCKHTRSLGINGYCSEGVRKETT